MQQRIGFIGSGNMAKSIILGLIKTGWANTLLTVSSPGAQSKDWIHQQQITIAENNLELAKACDIIVVATKPKQISNALRNLKLSQTQCLISIAAGISVDYLCESLAVSSQNNIIRAMPNTPSLIGKGICGLYTNPSLSADFKKIAEVIFSTVGQSVWIDDESKMDVVTAISGSGPAYYFLMVESIIDAGCKQGLSKEIATTLAYETILGTAELLKSSKLSPNQLREQVTSPGGTTAAAIESFQSSNFETIVKNAVDAATMRGNSLLQESYKQQERKE